MTLPWAEFLVDLYLCVEALGSEAVEQVVPLALEKLVRLDGNEDVEITLRASAKSGLAFAGETDARARLDPGGDVHAEATSGGRTRVEVGIQYTPGDLAGAFEIQLF